MERGIHDRDHPLWFGIGTPESSLRFRLCWLRRNLWWDVHRKTSNSLRFVPHGRAAGFIGLAAVLLWRRSNSVHPSKTRICSQIPRAGQMKKSFSWRFYISRLWPRFILLLFLVFFFVVVTNALYTCGVCALAIRFLLRLHRWQFSCGRWIYKIKTERNENRLTGLCVWKHSDMKSMPTEQFVLFIAF